MRPLIATAMYPSEDRPAFGTFVRTQVESLRALGVDAEPFVLDGRNRKVMYAGAVTRLRRRLRARPVVDLVHAHYGLVGLVARAQRQVPLVVTYHGDDLLGSRDEHGRIVPHTRAITAAGARLARHVDAVVVQSREMAERLPGVPNVHVIPCEVDLDLFRPGDRDAARQVLGLDRRRRYVLFAASPTIAVKRFPLVRDAMGAVRDQLGDVELLVVHREPQPRLVDYLRACDVLALPSYQEGSPNVVKQAMACGLPVVATDVGDVREMIGSTDGCAVVDADVGAFADALIGALRRPARTDGRAAVLHLRPDLVAGRLLDVYRDVCERAARGPVDRVGPRRGAA